MGIPKMYLKKKTTMNRAKMIQILLSIMCTTTGLISGAMGTRNRYTMAKKTMVKRVSSKRELGSLKKSCVQRRNQPNKLFLSDGVMPT